ncbi:oligoribonuclease [Pseudoclavibacter chungangensis]|uniref:Oligoribonuclease n=1 Tax=Pseudoclavibacter chungangensis TaxID=587635 RepID=A0A7J5BTK2_9MICO|nr:oligoribonuclease [Pseudoclavibacter chungangensis]KAB1656867.1 oligoribonuclease [Pseudoclavibacter chungangensis]NYJ67334.1 oligoribonuclease [Pseudoclavibacter chungangensis]
MSNGNDKLVWIDCEMTGLDVSVDELVEVAVVVTDFELNLLDPGFDVVIKPSDAALAHMGEFVRDMHTTSGLLEEIPGGLDLATAEQQVVDYIKRFVPASGAAPLAGNTIGTDRMFLAKYMPLVDGHLHYRNIDVSTIKELSRRWYPRVYFNAPEKHGGHRATADILESIRELQYYREAAFVAQPGPSTDTLKTISSDVVSTFAKNL